MQNFILPEEFKLYLSDEGELAEVQIDSSYREIILPTVNDYKGSGGCYLVCYSVDSNNHAYPLGDGTYVAGQLRIDGKYFGRICTPNFAVNLEEHDLCHAFLPKMCLPNACWIGRDTGAWFGIE